MPSRSNCPWCHASGRILYDALSDRLYGTPGSWTLRRCPEAACGLVWLDPLPGDLPSLYRNYFTHLPGGARRRRRRLVAEPLFRTSTRLLYRWTQLEAERRSLAYLVPNPSKAGSVLDVGCGGGDRLKLLARIGWRVTGQDVDPRAVETARQNGLADVRLGDLAALRLPAGSFDAVIASHVIEHVPDPVEFLAECLRLTAPSGSVVFTTPNIDSWGHGHFGRAWLGLDPPRHLHLFTPTTLAQLARRARARSFDVTTTAAQAEFIAAGSLDLRWHGTHLIGERGKTWRDLVAFTLQSRASAAHRADPWSGDECMLRIDADG